MQECLRSKEDSCIFFSLSTGYACFGKSLACVCCRNSFTQGDDEDLDREELVFHGMGFGMEVAETDGMTEGNSDGRSENSRNQNHTEESVQKSLQSGEKDIIEKASEEELEEDLEEEEFEEGGGGEKELEEQQFKTTNKADTTDNAGYQNVNLEEEKSRDEVIIVEKVEKRKMWKKPAGQLQVMAHGKWTADGVWRMEKIGKTQSEILKEELKTTVMQLGVNPLPEEVELEEKIWKEFKQMVEEKTAEEKVEEEKWAKAKAGRLEKEVEEETKRLTELTDDGQLEYEMIEKIRKRVYMTPEERKEEEMQERLAHIKEKEGTLRPSLFANVPPFLRFVPTNSLPGEGMSGRSLSEGMVRMGWYNWERDQDRNVVDWAVQDCIE